MSSPIVASSVSKLGVYDNWEKLVDGVFDREELRRLALCDSFSTTTSTSFSRLNSTATSTFNYEAPTNGSGTLAKPIQLTYQVIIAVDVAASFKQECAELKSRAEKLATLLHQAAQASDVLFERPTRRIIDETERVLAKALSLVLKCRGNGLMNRVLVISPASAFRKMSSLLESSIGDVSWLLRVYAPSTDDNEYLGLPPIAANEPILCLIWEQIAILYSGNIDDQGDAAASLVSLARENDRYRKLIIEEGGVGPLLKLMKEGKVEGQENAARAIIGLLGKDPESVEHIIHAGVCDVFVEILEEGPAKVQAVVAWAVSELAAHYPKCQDLFARLDIIALLTRHLAFETVQENAGIRGSSDRAGEMEDPATKLYLKAMVARALCYLARQNDAICRTIAESQALLCFAILLEGGLDEVRLNSAMALMEITAVAEKNPELRSAFDPSSPEYKAIVDQLFRIIEEAGFDDLLVPCVRAIGNLALIYRVTETRMINPLVRLLEERNSNVSKEACIALTKFACAYNYLYLDHTRAIIRAGGVKQLVQLVYFEDIVRSSALVLLCYIALHAPDGRELVEAGVLSALEWASEQTDIEDLTIYCNDNLAYLMQWEDIKGLLRNAKGFLELYHSRNSRGWSYQYG